MSLTPVQISTPGVFNGSSLSASTTLNGVTAGNTIVCIVMHGDKGGSGPSISVSDAQGSYTLDVGQTNGGLARVNITRLANANSGTHTITATASSGTTANSHGTVIAVELPPCTLDQTNVGGSGSGTTTPSVAATAALAAIGELAIGGLYFDSMGSGGGTFPPTGGTGTYTELATHNDNADGAYQTLTSTAGVGISWGTFSFSAKWSAAIAVYQASAVPIVQGAVPTPGSPALNSPRNINQFIGVGRVSAPAPTIPASLSGLAVSMSVVYGPNVPPASFGFIPSPGPGPAGPFNNNQFLSRFGDTSAPSGSTVNTTGLSIGNSVAYGLATAAGNLSGLAVSMSTVYGPGTTIISAGPISGLAVSQSVAYALLNGAAQLSGGISVSMSLSFASLVNQPIFVDNATGGQQLSPDPNVFAPAGYGGQKWGANGGGVTPVGGGVSGQLGWDNPIAETISTAQRQANYVVNGKPIAARESDTSLPTTTPDDSLPPGGGNVG